MLSRIGTVISAAFRRVAPDPFVIAVVLAVVTAVIALWIGFPAPAGGVRPPMGDRVGRLVASWGVEGGLWDLLKFSMQMCLILVTGHALAASRPVKRLLTLISGLPRSGAAAAATVAAAACAAALVNWGLGLIVGAFLAREVGRSMAARGITVHYPLLAAAGYTGLMIWHGGLSGSAPLSMTTVRNATAALPADLVTRIAEVAAPDGGPALLGLERTIGSPMNLFITGGLLALVPLVCYFLSPRAEECVPMSRLAPERPEAAPEVAGDGDGAGALPDWLERSPLVPWLLVVAFAGALGTFVAARGVGGIGLDEINLAIWGLGLALHGSVRSYLAAVEEGARGCAGIIVQFPLYAGVIAMMKVSGLVGIFADGFLAMGNERTVPLMSCFAAAAVNIFVPSGGGQWAVQGPIALQAGLDAGIDPGKMVMTVAYGDQLTNMLQPFWALPLLAITGVRARDIVGYTAVIMLAGGVWITLGLLLF